jgi:hypothetical protein
LTVGPWRPISLHIYHTCISDLYISAQVDENLETDLIVRITLSPSETLGSAEILLKDAAGLIVTSRTDVTVNGGFARVVFHFKKGDIRLWYPVGYGKQPLYDVQVKVIDDVRPPLKGRNFFTESMIVARPGTGYQGSKGRIPPRPHCGGQASRSARTHLALRNK